MIEYETYEVYATYRTYELSYPFEEEFVGSLELRKIHTSQDAPMELEIDGIVYTPQL